MIEALLAAAGKVLDLLLKRGEHRQLKAQTALAEVQLKREESRIVLATMDEVRRYDRSVAELDNRIECCIVRMDIRTRAQIPDDEADEVARRCLLLGETVASIRGKAAELRSRGGFSYGMEEDTPSQLEAAADRIESGEYEISERARRLACERRWNPDPADTEG